MWLKLMKNLPNSLWNSAIDFVKLSRDLRMSRKKNHQRRRRISQKKLLLSRFSVYTLRHASQLSHCELWWALQCVWASARAMSNVNKEQVRVGRCLFLIFHPTLVLRAVLSEISSFKGWKKFTSREQLRWQLQSSARASKYDKNILKSNFPTFFLLV